MKVGSINEQKENDTIPETTRVRKRTRSSESQQKASVSCQATLKVNKQNVHNDKLRHTSFPMLTDVIKDNSIVLKNPYRDRSATAPSAISLENEEQQQRDFSVMQLKHGGNNGDPRMHAFQQKKRPVLMGRKRRRVRPSNDVSLIFHVIFFESQNLIRFQNE